MTCCNHCQDAGNLFGDRAARRDLRRYRSRGPSASTQLLLEALLSQESDHHTLLDIGGGVGAIPLALLQAGYRQAVEVDASRSYLATAEAEATRRGIHDRTPRNAERLLTALQRARARAEAPERLEDLRTELGLYSEG